MMRPALTVVVASWFALPVSVLIWVTTVLRWLSRFALVALCGLAAASCTLIWAS